MAQRVFAVFDDNKLFINKTCFIITSDKINLKFLSSILSSKTLQFIFKFLGSPLQGKFYNLNKTFVEILPIYLASPEVQRPFIELADQMLQLHKDNKIARTPQEKKYIERQINATDKQIDKLVYELYNLTDEEIRIIEDS